MHTFASVSENSKKNKLLSQFGNRPTGCVDIALVSDDSKMENLIMQALHQLMMAVRKINSCHRLETDQLIL